MLDCLTSMGNILVVVEEMVRQETSLTNTSAESQGTCICIHVVSTCFL